MELSVFPLVRACFCVILHVFEPPSNPSNLGLKTISEIRTLYIVILVGIKVVNIKKFLSKILAVFDG